MYTKFPSGYDDEISITVEIDKANMNATYSLFFEENKAMCVNGMFPREIHKDELFLLGAVSSKFSTISIPTRDNHSSCLLR